MDSFKAMPWNERLRMERLRHHWRQREVAEKLGTAVLTIQRWERGSQRPSAYYRIKLCELYGQTAQALGLEESSSLGKTADQDPHEETSQQTVTARDREILTTEMQPPQLTSSHASGRPWSMRLIGLVSFLVLLVFSLAGIMASQMHFSFSGTQPSLTTPQAIKATLTAMSKSITNPYGPATAALVFADPLRQENHVSNWQNDDATPTSPLPYGSDRCFFANQAYEVLANGPNNCDEYAMPFRDLTYQVAYSQIQGQSAGIDFRTNGEAFYYFHVDIQGRFRLDLATPQSVTILKAGTCPWLLKGLKQWNLLAVKARGSTIDLYINLHQVASFTDMTYTNGWIGVDVGIYQERVLNQALFRDARVWL